MKIWSSFTRPQVVPNLYQNNGIYFENMGNQTVDGPHIYGEKKNTMEVNCLATDILAKERNSYMFGTT